MCINVCEYVKVQCSDVLMCSVTYELLQYDSVMSNVNVMNERVCIGM